jgi:hypothetical protein
MGAAVLSEIASELETAIKAADSKTTYGLLGELEKAFIECKVALSQKTNP